MHSSNKQIQQLKITKTGNRKASKRLLIVSTDCLKQLGTLKFFDFSLLVLYWSTF